MQDKSIFVIAYGIVALSSGAVGFLIGWLVHG